MNDCFTIIDLEQRSQKWIEWRKNKIGSSHSSSIFGCNPYKSARELWEEMKGLRLPSLTTDAMQRGIDLESEALDWVQHEKKISLSPLCIEYKKHPQLIASIDGANIAQRVICEIKVSDKRYKMAQMGKISPLDYCQIQHQLMITGFESSIYCVYEGFSGVILEIKRDDVYITSLRNKELEFCASLQKNDYDFDENDFIKLEVENESKEAVLSWLKIKREQKSLESSEKRIREVLHDLGDDGNIIFTINGKDILKMERVEREGSVDWDALCKDKGISAQDILSYRKKQMGYYKIQPV